MCLQMMRTLPLPKLSEAMELYLQFKGAGKVKTFQQAARRNLGVGVNVVDQMGLGAKDIDA